MIETKVIIYDDKREMDKGIKSMQKNGWKVLSTQAVEQGYSASKTCCLGVMFLPLALLGKKSEKYQVTYQREKK